MTNPDSDAERAQQFRLSEDDLNRIAAHIEVTRQAQDLTDLARLVIGDVLRSHPRLIERARVTKTEHASVRLWDPAGKWEVGDHAIVAVRLSRDRFEPYVGEVAGVDGDRVHILIAGSGQSKTYFRARPGSQEAHTWHLLVKDIVEAKASAQEEREQIDGVILTQGEHIISELFNALRASDRFVCVDGMWYLVELASLPSAEQIIGLAWRMIRLEEPAPTSALLPLVKPPLPEGDQGLFGLYLAIEERPDLFKNTEAGQVPRWVLSGHPPGGFLAEHAAYDPDTYEVLCLPDRPVGDKAARRVLELDLVEGVV